MRQRRTVPTNTQKWLRRQPRARTLDELQSQLDWFINYYNTKRPHRAIGNNTPQERWSATEKITNPGIALPAATHTVSITVDQQGIVRTRPWAIHVGVDYAGRTARVLIDDTHAAIYINNTLIRHLKLDQGRAYQPSGKKRGGPRRRLP